MCGAPVRRPDTHLPLHFHRYSPTHTHIFLSPISVTNRYASGSPRERLPEPRYQVHRCTTYVYFLFSDAQPMHICFPSSPRGRGRYRYTQPSCYFLRASAANPPIASYSPAVRWPILAFRKPSSAGLRMLHRRALRDSICGNDSCAESDPA
jgi:hypothetical protein